MPTHEETMDEDVPQQISIDTGRRVILVGDFLNLSKRELFAAMAMQGLVSLPNQNSDGWTFEALAQGAVRQADALLAALKEKA